MNVDEATIFVDSTERVIHVDEYDRIIGPAGKLEVHQAGLLHRAFSVFLFNPDGQLLLQRRALSKYHSGGLWANSCCGHPRPGERTRDAAVRRVCEELGITVDITESFRFRYHVELANGLIENELVHMMFGRFAGTPVPDPREVSDVRWLKLGAVAKDISEQPQCYAPWLRLYFQASLSDIVRFSNSLAIGADRRIPVS